ncbi:MAG: hypothetical protein BLM47_11510 [Candidatus Reconcilbacillus cellulovorans]|uniref:EamA domain-containing protein n=1 Tax=Candidatus Reconcilbacillus cellulovorans TaxID=1906605 RepID=A0A2A6DXW8_9BACL|nr:MAG: hypothetical protein BLM47_11510 [Candidatus Reconcilbacillus cellulovorans]
MWMALALGAAVCFGLRGVLYRKTSQKTRDWQLLLCGGFLTGAIVSLALALAARQRWTADVWIGAVMGVLSFAGNASMYRGLAVGKTSIVAVLSGLPPVVAAAAAYFFWGERLNAFQATSFVLIMAAVPLLKHGGGWSGSGAVWGLLTMLFFGLNDAAGKQSARLGADIFPVMFAMFATGTSLFALAQAFGRRRGGGRRGGGAGDPDSAGHASWGPLETFAKGMAVGLTNVVGLTFMLSAMRTGPTALVSAIAGLNVLLLLLYGRLALRESFTRPELAGMALALSGVVLLRLFG